MTATTISNNTANFGGGFWAGHNAIANLTNVTIADNSANMGGGVWFAGGITGTFLNCTVAGNQGDGLFNGDTGVTLQNTIVANNTHGTMDSATNCSYAHGDGGHDLQWPSGATACAASVTFADPMLGALGDNGGPVETMPPAAGSPAAGAGTGCPPTDARGIDRPTACTLGAVEIGG